MFYQDGRRGFCPQQSGRDDPKAVGRMVGNGEVVTVVAGVNEGSTLIIVILGYSLHNMSSPV